MLTLPYHTFSSFVSVKVLNFQYHCFLQGHKSIRAIKIGTFSNHSMHIRVGRFNMTETGVLETVKN